jgi:hypothetical protein
MMTRIVSKSLLLEMLYFFRAGGRQLPTTPANRRQEAAQLQLTPANRRLETDQLPSTAPNRRLEAALNKFTDIALPFHLHMIAQHRINILRVSGYIFFTNEQQQPQF